MDPGGIELKKNFLVSVVMGTLFGVVFYVLWRAVDLDGALPGGVLAGVLSHMMLFVYLTIHERGLNRRYAEAEAAITGPWFLKAEGVVRLEKRVCHCNLYFIHDRLLILWRDDKPYGQAEIPRGEIESISFQGVVMTIRTSGG